MRSRLYLGHVMHARKEPVAHRFSYPAFAFALDVDELPELDRNLRLFGHNRAGLFSLHESDYLGAGHGISSGDSGPQTMSGDHGAFDGDLRAKLRRRIDDAGARIELHRIELVTTPRFAGHTFNPVSFYYCYATDATLSGIVAEVNNTFGEAHVFVLPASQAVRTSGERFSFVAPKRFHVSPFNDMEGAYEFHFNPLDERLDVRIEIRRAEGKTFASRLRGDVRPLDNTALLRLAATYPLTTALTLPRIMWQAYKLHYRKGLPVFAKPDPASPQTFAATRPAYISEFSAPTWLQRRAARQPSPRDLDRVTEMKENHGSH
jgi:cyclopropane-fatty-acyl-phospholipid synthase